MKRCHAAQWRTFITIEKRLTDAVTYKVPFTRHNVEVNTVGVERVDPMAQPYNGLWLISRITDFVLAVHTLSI